MTGVVGLADFAEHRRFHLLWQHHLHNTVDEIERLVGQAAHRRCPLPDAPASAPERSAILGSDGRYHLHVDGRRTCNPHYPYGDQAGQVWEHTQSCHWWSDGHRYLLQPPKSGDDESHRCDRVTVHYTVEATDTVAEPDEIPRHLRCPETRSSWPAFRTSATDLGWLREQLIDAFGPLCATCRHNPGQVVDHDHFTRYVRGLLCQYCNAWVDRCLHVSGCGFADYLNHPPATSLRLVHPALLHCGVPTSLVSAAPASTPSPPPRRGSIYTARPSYSTRSETARTPCPKRHRNTLSREIGITVGFV